MKKYVKNIITGKKILLPEPINNEKVFDGGVMITETDTRGIITYANQKFREMTGYTKEELIGSPHSINRHPDMPKVAFQKMWNIIKSGEYWNGHVRNMCKDGSFYHVEVWIKPKWDRDNNIEGYIAGRMVPSKIDLEESLTLYQKLLEEEENNCLYLI
jgi:PAS domain S-box-containing protein